VNAQPRHSIPAAASFRELIDPVLLIVEYGIRQDYTVVFIRWRAANISAEKKTTIILAAIALSEGCWVFFNVRHNPSGFLRYAGFTSNHAGVFGWILGVVVAIAFVAIASRLPSVRSNLFRASLLKILALAVAISAGLCEECIFRKLLMDSLQHAGLGVAIQVLASGSLFGLAHGVWGFFRGSLAAGVGASLATGMLGLALALVYVASHRIVVPAILSHFLINAFAEPGLVLAAVRGEIGRPQPL
jgi:membrane protease YdiL (CAAX protease family)